MVERTSYWLSVDRQEIAALQASLSAYLVIRYDLSKLSKSQTKMYHKMRDEMKYMQVRLGNLVSFEYEYVGKPIQ